MEHRSRKRAHTFKERTEIQQNLHVLTNETILLNVRDWNIIKCWWEKKSLVTTSKRISSKEGKQMILCER